MNNFEWALTSALGLCAVLCIALALRSRQLRARVGSLTGGMTDPLTGLPNRSGFHGALSEEVRQARSDGRELSVVVIEIDNFTTLDAVSGPLAGDALVIEVAAGLGRHARARDTLASLGAGQFAWILPDTDRRTAHRVIARARLGVANPAVGDRGPTLLSVGIADLARAGTGDRLYPRAIEALQVARERQAPPPPPALQQPSVLVGTELSRRPLQRVRSMARDVDSRDGGDEHSSRVGDLAAAMASAMGWGAADAARLRDAALVHDVGKYAIDGSVVGKHTELDPGERALVERHPIEGAAIAGEVLDDDQAAWIRHHHERWDGTGYPAGLGADDIPMGSAIIAVAEAWDVIVSGRRYQAARVPDLAWEELRRGSGTQWSPAAVDALARVLPKLGG